MRLKSYSQKGRYLMKPSVAELSWKTNTKEELYILAQSGAVDDRMLVQLETTNKAFKKSNANSSFS